MRAASIAPLVAVALWAVPGAGAAITSSQVRAPADPTFGIYEPEAPSTIAVTGTTTGAVVGEGVDLRCYFGASNSTLIDPGVTVALNAFSATIVPSYPTTCRLRAVPAGTEPTELAPFGGPVLAVGESQEYFTQGGENEGTPYDFYANGQQLTAADDYDSINTCGLSDSYLRNAEFEQHSTFFCNDFYANQNASGHPAESAFRVDGSNVYFSNGADRINGEANGLPPLAYSYSQDSANGDLTISDGESPAICPDPTYPPTSRSCEKFLPSGVRDERTIEQTHDGHLVVITDSFKSTDGKAHAVEALPENEQDFNRHGQQIEYKFPGESTYVPRVDGDSVSFADAGPGAVYIRVTGAADGDTETGRGAIVFFQPSSPAYFNDFLERRNSFYFDNRATVPATGTTTIKYAYAQAFYQAEVEALVDAATRSTEAPPVAPPAPVAQPGGAAGSGPSSATFRIGKVHHFKAIGTLKMQIVATGRGQLSLTGKRVGSVSRRIAHRGTSYLTLTATTALRELMVQRGTVHVTVNVSFTPDIGPARVKVKKMGLVLDR